MSLLQPIVLGIIQGLTEFFPVSSSGHLVLTPVLFGWDDQGLAFDTILHLGTLIAVIWAYRTELWGVGTRAMGQGGAKKAARLLLLRVCIAAIPGLLIGFVMEPFIAGALRWPLLVAVDLAFWGIVMFVADRFASTRARSVKDLDHLTWLQILLIGFSQAIAVLPGTSRSGITMTAGLFSGLDRKTAVDFSFLVSIPTIAAAGGYGMLKLLREGVPSGDWGALLIGFLAATITGAWAIRFLRSYVAKHSFTIFVWYRLALAAVVLVVARFV